MIKKVFFNRSAQVAMATGIAAAVFLGLSAKDPMKKILGNAVYLGAGGLLFGAAINQVVKNKI